MAQKKFFEKDLVDREIDRFASLDKPTRGDLNRVRSLARLQLKLKKYRAGADKMTEVEIEAEKHSCRRLGQHMTAAGDPRPHKLCHAHAIVSGGHEYAAELRAVLAWFKLRIDDPHNGCWLPGTKEALSQMPERLRNAAPHLSIHRREYYEWIEGFLSFETVDTRGKLVEALNFLEHRLQSGAYPPEVVTGRKI